ncbi:MAG: cysteine protease [Xanthomonadales bacterium]|nr:cysteine protease [Xanthomonadales bacterium]
MRTMFGKGLGWQREIPDFRDYTSETESVATLLSKSGPLKRTLKGAPTVVDLRAFCSPVEDQEQLGSCTAHAGIGMLEYFERRAFGNHLDASRLFLYKVTRQLLGFAGDDGAYLRDTMKALVLFGVPPEKYWPYQQQRFNDEPSAFCFAYAQSYQTIEYYRLDSPSTPGGSLINKIRSSLAAGLPAMFGFTVYSSMPPLGDGKGEVPFPGAGDRVEGGHAVLAVGYDDKKQIGKCKGALLIRNSWSESWGEGGYGWLPYKYVEAGLATDFWTMVKAEFVDSEIFKA